MPGTQVVRIESYNKASLSGVVHEANRTPGIQFRNSDHIDSSLSQFNISYKSLGEKTPLGAFNQMRDDLSVESDIRKNTQVIQEVIITSGSEFFDSIGFEFGKKPNDRVRSFFDEAYSWILSEFGFDGTDKNILAASVHLDEPEGNPHLQVVFVPLVTKWREKVYEKDENGILKRNSNGSPIQAKDENGKNIYVDREDFEHPRISKSEFWKQRGGNKSYTMLQDRFYDQVASKWDLGRGQVGSTAKHKSQYAWHKEQELNALDEQLKDTRAEVGKVEGAARRAKLKSRSAKEDLSTLEAQIKEAKRERDKAEDEASKAKQNSAASVRKARKARKDAAVAIADKAEAEKKLEAVQGDITDAENKLAAVKEAHADVQAQIDTADAELNKIKADTATAKFEAEAIQVKLQVAKNDLVSLEAEKSETQKLIDQRDALWAEIGSVSGGIELVESIWNRGRRALGGKRQFDMEDAEKLIRFAKRGAANEKLNAEIYIMQKTVKDAEKRVNTAEARASDAERSEQVALAQVEPLKKENAKLKAQVIDLEDQVFDLQEEVDEFPQKRREAVATALEKAKTVIHDLASRFLDVCLLAAGIGERYKIEDKDLRAGCENAIEYACDGLEKAGEISLAHTVETKPRGLTGLFRSFIERIQNRQKEKKRAASWDMER